MRCWTQRPPNCGPCANANWPTTPPADAPPAAFLWLLAAATCLDRAAASSLAANPLSPNDWRAVRPFDFFERRLRNIRRRKGADK